MLYCSWENDMNKNEEVKEENVVVPENGHKGLTALFFIMHI